MKNYYNAENNLDFVDISTPPCDHAKIAIAAMAKGIHVLCEKPLAVNTAEANAACGEKISTGIIPPAIIINMRP